MQLIYTCDFSEFGVKPLGDIKPLVKALNKIFAHSDKTVRAEVSNTEFCAAIQLTVRWIRVLLSH
jgi:hypothetical protein